MNEMWIALERYQPFADKHGFGAAWLKMTTERTAAAAKAAANAASPSANAARIPWVAMWAGMMALDATRAVVAKDRASKILVEAAAEAVALINRAIELEETK